MHIFYTPDIERIRELPEEESLHCAKVLRLSEGTEIVLADGKGTFYRAILTRAHQKRCAVEIVSALPQPRPWAGKDSYSDGSYQEHGPYRNGWPRRPPR